MDIISRKAAKAAGLQHYFTGKPCKRRGHRDRRWVCSFMCVECGREKSREAYRQLPTSERREISVRRRTYHSEWYDKHREEQKPKYAAHRIKAKAEKPNYFKQHYAANKERRKQESQAWYRANAEYALERQKSYVAKQMVERPDHIRAQKRKAANTRRAIVHSVFVEVIDPRVVFARDLGICGICAAPVDPASPWEIDHIIPISKGGPHAYANVQLSHRTCNRSKSARLR